jgi:hypothetical protein
MQKLTEIWDKYDVIAGKVADDDTNATITFYLNGAYGELNSEDAVSVALKQLKPEVLENQICLKSRQAIDKLTYVACEEVKKHV